MNTKFAVNVAPLKVLGTQGLVGTRNIYFDYLVNNKLENSKIINDRVY